MTPWIIREFVTEEHLFLLRDWYAAQGPEVQAAFDVTALILRQTPDWLDPETEIFKLLRRKHAGLGEIRFHVDV